MAYIPAASLGANGLYTLLESIWNPKDKTPCCWMDTGKLAGMAGVSVPTLRKLRRELEGAELIHVERGRDGILIYRGRQKEGPFIPKRKDFSRPYNRKNPSRIEQQQQPALCAPLDDGGTALPPKPKPAETLPAEILQAIEEQVERESGRLRNPGGYRRTLIRLAHEGRYAVPQPPPSARMEPYSPPWLDSAEPTAQDSPEVRAEIGRICSEFLRGATRRNGG